MWGMLLAVIGCILTAVLLIYLLSLRKTFSIRGKHVMVRIMRVYSLIL